MAEVLHHYLAAVLYQLTDQCKLQYCRTNGVKDKGSILRYCNMLIRLRELRIPWKYSKSRITIY